MLTIYKLPNNQGKHLCRTEKKNILVVDDDPDIRELISLLMDMEGHQVAELDIGKSVLSQISSQRPDLVLLDAILGDADGRDICRLLKTCRKPVAFR